MSKGMIKINKSSAKSIPSLPTKRANVDGDKNSGDRKKRKVDDERQRILEEIPEYHIGV